MKSQTIRLIDVFALGPFMIWAAQRSRDLPPAARTALAVSGLLTIVYNGANYLRLAEPRKEP